MLAVREFYLILAFFSHPPYSSMELTDDVKHGPCFMDMNKTYNVPHTEITEHGFSTWDEDQTWTIKKMFLNQAAQTLPEWVRMTDTSFMDGEHFYNVGS